MKWIVTRMKWVMLVSGLLTLTMLKVFVAPQRGLRSLFGDSLEGPVAEIVVRSWGSLIALVGAMLIYGAFRPSVRPLVLIVAGLSKAIFISLILIYGPQFLGHQAGVAVAFDSAMVLLFVTYLVAARHAGPAA